MSLDDLSRRVALALGLGAVVACSKAKDPAGVEQDPAQVSSVAPTPSASVASPTASASVVSPTPSASVVSPTPESPPRPPHPFGHGCGFEIVCNPPHSKPPPAHAKAPFERCAASVPAKADSALGEGVFDEELTKTRFTNAPTCCYKVPRTLCGGGRPLVAQEGARLAAFVSRSDYASLEEPSGPARRDLGVAARHLRDAACEHASVASFARVSLVLLSLGAPPALLAEVHAAAADEVRHAQVFCALAARRGAPALGPGPLSLEGIGFGASVAELVAETLRDGCVSEARALLDLEARLAEGDSVERVHLARIIEDEGRHVELAWKTLAWAVRAHGAEARPALAQALAALEQDPDALVRQLVSPLGRALLTGPEEPVRPSRVLESPRS